LQVGEETWTTQKDGSGVAKVVPPECCLRVIRARGGANVALPVGGPDRPQVGVEFGVPVYQDLNGIQLPEDWRLSVSLGHTF